MRKNYRHWLAIAAVITGFNCNVFAQTDSTLTEEAATVDDDIFDIALEDLLNMDMELTTGSFLEMNLKSSTTSLTLISDEQIYNSGARHLSEVLEIYVPGFQYMVNKWNGITWGMRGVAADRNTKFIFLINGHKMNHESRDGAMSELDLGMMADIERIEVLRGPSGLVYGSGAIAGVVNIVTKDVNEAQNEVRTNLHTWKMESIGGGAEVLANKQFNEDLGVNISLGMRGSQGVGAENSRIYGKASWPYPDWRDDLPTNGVPTTGAAWSTPGNVKLGTTVKYKDLKIYSRVTHQVTNASGWFPVEGWPDYPNGPDSTASPRIIDGASQSYDSFYGAITPYNTNRRQYVIDNVMLMGQYNLEVGENELVFTGGYDGVTNRIQREKTTTYVSNGNYVSERNGFIEETFGERRYDLGAMYSIKSIDKLQLAIGYQFRLFDIGNDLSGKNAVGEINARPVVSDVTYTNNAFYAEGLYDISNFLSVNFGLRYDIHTRASFASPKLALIGRLNEDNVIKLIFQSSANTGSADNYEYNRWHYDNNGQTYNYWHYENEDQRPNAASNVIPPAPTQDELHDLKPERATSLELASVHEIEGKLFVSPSVSYTQIKNLFIWEQALFRVFNGGTYNVLNFDIETKYVSSKLDMGLNHTLQKPINTDIDQTIEYDVPVWDHANADSTSNPGYYIPVAETDANGNTVTNKTEVNYMKNSITRDGQNFLNLVTNITKFYMDYKPSKFMTLHTSVRVFWGMAGRRYMQEDPTYQKFTDAGLYKGFHDSPLVKWNVGLHLHPSTDWTISFMAYDILASGTNRNSFRWQQMAEPAQSDIYASDIRSFAMNLSYKF